MENMDLLAGTATADISPGKGLELAGYPHYPRYNTGVHDPLYASCIYLNNGYCQLVIVTLDLLFYSKKHVSTVRKKIQTETGIPQGNMMISCSHTHSGPWVSGRLDIDSLLNGVRQDEEYVYRLNETIVSVVKEAVKNAFPAQIGYAKGACGREQGIGGNRRNKDGPCDPEVCVLALADLNGRVKAAYVNYALHPTVIHEDSTLVSADYPGYIREYLKKCMPGMNLLFAQGTSGDQSSRYFRHGQSFGEAERIGYAIGREVKRVLEQIDYSRDIPMFMLSKEMTITLRKLPPKEDAELNVTAARTFYDTLRLEKAPYLELQNANLKLLGAEDLLGYILMLEDGRKIELYEDEREAEVQVMGIGDARIVGLPG